MYIHMCHLLGLEVVGVTSHQSGAGNGFPSSAVAAKSRVSSPTGGLGRRSLGLDLCVFCSLSFFSQTRFQVEA